MRKPSPFHEAKPRTPKSEARQREIKAMETMVDLLDLDDEEASSKVLPKNTASFKEIRGTNE